MSPTTTKYVRSLEFAALGGALPVLLDYLNQPHLDWHTVVKAAASAAITSSYAFFRANPPPDPDPGPILPPPKP